jgi:hypothetical protein
VRRINEVGALTVAAMLLIGAGLALKAWVGF